VRWQEARGFQHNVAYNLQALRAELVEGVLRAVPEDVVVTVRKINQVGHGHADAGKGQVVVLHRVQALEKVRLVAQAGGGLADQVLSQGVEF